MAVTADVYLPYDAGAGSNVTEDYWRRMFRRVLNTSGVFRDQANKCQVFGDSTGMQVKVKTGEAWIEGHFMQQNQQITLPIAAAHATLARKDRVVLRNDFTNNRMEFDVLTGTPAGSPTVMSLTQNTSIWEISLGIVDVAALASTITAGNVTDARHYNDAFPAFAVCNTEFTVNNQTTPQTVADLAWPMSADAKYTIEGYLYTFSSTTADSKVQIIVPSDASGYWSGRTLDVGAGSYAGNFDGGAIPVNSSFGVAGADPTWVGVGILGTLTMGPTAGNLQIKFAQNVAQSYTTKLGIGSWIKCTRIRPAS